MDNVHPFEFVGCDKIPRVGVAPLPNALTLLPKILGKGDHNESKYIWIIIKEGINEKLNASAFIACSLHRTVIDFKIARIFSSNTIETLSGPLCPSFSVLSVGPLHYVLYYSLLYILGLKVLSMTLAVSSLIILLKNKQMTIKLVRLAYIFI